MHNPTLVKNTWGDMIKFRIHPQNLGGERSKFGKMLEKCQNYIDSVNIFWDILDAIKDNLSQECVEGCSILLGQNWNSFFSFDPTFPPVPP